MKDIINLDGLSKNKRKKYEGLMYFQIWHNKEITANLIIEDVKNVLDDCVDLYLDIQLIFEYCKDNNILCDGAMLHYTTGCFFAKND